MEWIVVLLGVVRLVILEGGNKSQTGKNQVETSTKTNENIIHHENAGKLILHCDNVELSQCIISFPAFSSKNPHRERHKVRMTNHKRMPSRVSALVNRMKNSRCVLRIMRRVR